MTIPRLWLYKGETKTCKELAELAGIPYPKMLRRITNKTIVRDDDMVKNKPNPHSAPGLTMFAPSGRKAKSRKWHLKEKTLQYFSKL